ncbi:MAG: methionine biosynthesis protein MetW [Gammaproteobacteria bacterium]
MVSKPYPLRNDLALISRWIRHGSQVLDLGCGDGSLLVYLRDHRGVSGYGLEIDNQHIVQCMATGVNVIQTDLDAGLHDFGSGKFDYVIMTQTLQAVRFPDRLLLEMLRIGREGIVTFPNFGHWKPRLHLALRGAMPISRALPHQWYNTPNIHLCTLRDFEQLCQAKGIDVLQRAVVDIEHQEVPLMRLFPNLLGELAIYRLCLHAPS